MKKYIKGYPESNNIDSWTYEIKKGNVVYYYHIWIIEWLKEKLNYNIEIGKVNKVRKAKFYIYNRTEAFSERNILTIGAGLFVIYIYKN